MTAAARGVIISTGTLMKQHRIITILLCLLFHLQLTYAANSTITIDFKNTNLTDAIRLLAKFTHKNVMISSSVNGQASLHFNQVQPEQALNLLLTTYGLAKWCVGNVWFVAPRQELINRQQEELKWKDLQVEASPLMTRVWQIKYAKADDIAHVLQNERASFISKRGHIQVDVRTNSLCVQEVADRMMNMHKLIQQLDVPVKQVAIAARLASVDSDFERELGIRFTVANENQNDHAKFITPETGKYSIAVATLADGSLLDVKLSALENAGHAELISSPRLFSASHQAASIEAGEEVPYQEVSNSGGTAIVFKKAVLGLKVTPQVLPGNKILLQMQINQDRPSNKMVLGMPTISTRQITTNLLIKSGQTIVLGGIFEINHENVEERVPFLSQLPIIGWLFIQQNTRNNKRELLIFVTPTII